MSRPLARSRLARSPLPSPSDPRGLVGRFRSTCREEFLSDRPSDAVAPARGESDPCLPASEESTRALLRVITPLSSSLAVGTGGRLVPARRTPRVAVERDDPGFSTSAARPIKRYH